jgi:2-oxoglutarate dehydrogenase E1 component
VAIVRLEQIYPFPKVQFEALLKKYKGADLMWVQEEPANMGAWSHIAVNHGEYGWKCSARRAASSPATGFPKAHEKEQAALVAAAFAI